MSKEIAQSQMIAPAGTVEQAMEQFYQYQELKNRLSTPDDFQDVGGKKHPKKSFVRKVQRYFNLSCELLKDEPLKDREGQIFAWVVTARALHVPTGAFQEADGSCSFEEKKAANQRTIHNVRAHAVTRAKNRAILDLVGFGDVSAEEFVEDAPEQQQKPPPARTSGLATEPQLRKLGAMAREADMDKEGLLELAQAVIGRVVSSSKELTKKECSDLIDYIERNVMQVEKNAMDVEVIEHDAPAQE